MEKHQEELLEYYNNKEKPIKNKVLGILLDTLILSVMATVCFKLPFGSFSDFSENAIDFSVFFVMFTQIINTLIFLSFCTLGKSFMQNQVINFEIWDQLLKFYCYKNKLLWVLDYLFRIIFLTLLVLLDRYFLAVAFVVFNYIYFTNKENLLDVIYDAIQEMPEDLTENLMKEEEWKV